MKKIITSTMALIILALMSCEESLTPESTTVLPKLLKQEVVNETTGATSLINYTYENDLLTKIASDQTEYRYSYTDDTISQLEIWDANSLVTRYDYSIENDTKVIVSQFVFDTGSAVLIRTEEREVLNSAELKYGFYTYPNGEKTLDYYIMKTRVGGNVIAEESFNPDGSSRNKVSSWSFGEAINPLSHVSGNLSSRNQNLATYHSFTDEGTTTIEQTHVIETNELNLPVEIRSVLGNTLFGDQRVVERYYYE